MTNAELDTILFKLYKQSHTARIVINNAIDDCFIHRAGIIRNIDDKQTNELQSPLYELIIYYGYGSMLSGNEFKSDNPNTAESIIIHAFSSLGLKPQIEVGKQSNIKRLGRTDVNVSSFCQLFCCKIIKTAKFQKLYESQFYKYTHDINDIYLVTTLLNKMLNPYIFVYNACFIKAQQGDKEFDPRASCTSRTYKYLLGKVPQQWYNNILNKRQQTNINISNSFFDNKLLNEINKQLLNYCGTHNFQYLSYEAGPAFRTIYSAIVKPILFNKKTQKYEFITKNTTISQNNTDLILFLLLSIVGKAFAYHQIRILSSIINRAIKQENANIIGQSLQQKAYWRHLEPGQRLCLVQCTYDDQNMKIYEGDNDFTLVNNQTNNNNVNELNGIIQLRQFHIQMQKDLQILE